MKTQDQSLESYEKELDALLLTPFYVALKEVTNIHVPVILASIEILESLLHLHLKLYPEYKVKLNELRDERISKMSIIQDEI